MLKRAYINKLTRNEGYFNVGEPAGHAIPIYTYLLENSDRHDFVLCQASRVVCHNMSTLTTCVMRRLILA